MGSMVGELRRRETAAGEADRLQIRVEELAAISTVTGRNARPVGSGDRREQLSRRRQGTGGVLAEQGRGIGHDLVLDSVPEGSSDPLAGGIGRPAAQRAVVLPPRPGSPASSPAS